MIARRNKIKMGEISIYVDGVSKGNPGISACAGLVYRDGQLESQFAYPLGITTNNVAEYCALILALVEARRLGNYPVNIYTDSLLLVKQIEGSYQVKDEWLKRLHLIATRLLVLFPDVKVRYINRQGNKEADKLANACLKKQYQVKGSQEKKEGNSAQTVRLPPRELFGEESPDSSREGGS